MAMVNAPAISRRYTKNFTVSELFVTPASTSDMFSRFLLLLAPGVFLSVPGYHAEDQYSTLVFINLLFTTVRRKMKIKMM